jgi:hypothetical protein
MDKQHHGGSQDQIEEHSLPGTNQTGKGRGDREEQREAKDERETMEEEEQEHSLPGTNQAGKDMPEYE